MSDFKKCSVLEEANISYADSSAVNAAVLGAQNTNSAMSTIDELRQQLADLSHERDLLRAALGGMLFEFDDGMGDDRSSDLLDHARALCDAVKFKPSAEVKS